MHYIVHITTYKFSLPRVSAFNDAIFREIFRFYSGTNMFNNFGYVRLVQQS